MHNLLTSEEHSVSIIELRLELRLDRIELRLSIIELRLELRLGIIELRLGIIERT